MNRENIESCPFAVECPLIVARVNVVEIDEPCAHEIQFGGLCAECGKDMTEYV